MWRLFVWSWILSRSDHLDQKRWLLSSWCITIGYARISTTDQNLGALTAAGAERLFSEKVSGAKAKRPELAKTLRPAPQRRCGGDEI
ncbi:MAG: recombinase family protein [Paracoccaceae bacterium]